MKNWLKAMGSAALLMSAFAIAMVICTAIWDKVGPAGIMIPFVFFILTMAFRDHFNN